jgi:soluble cytochrome b562
LSVPATLFRRRKPNGSFQVWREKAGDKPKYVYALTLKQITAIRAQADAELSAQNAELGEQIEAMRRALSEVEKQSAAKDTALKEEIAKLRHDQQLLVQELKPVLKKRTNDSLDNGGKSIRATSIPMGGAPVYRLRVKRR